MSICIPAYNDWPLLAKCLESIAANYGTAVQTIVVVNGSTDETSQRLGLRDGLEVVISGARVGIAAALNLAIDRARSEAVLILDSDMTVLPGAIEAMVDVLADHPTAGAVACERVNPDLSFQSQLIPLPTLASEVMMRWHLAGLLRAWRPLDAPRSDTETIDCALPAGGLMVRGAALAALGGFDEQFASAYHDVDLCARLLSAGYDIWFTRRAMVIHDMASPLKQPASSSRAEIWLQLVSYHRKHGGRMAALVAAMVLYVAIVPEVLLVGWRWLRRPSQRVELARSLRGNLGLLNRAVAAGLIRRATAATTAVPLP